MLSQRRWIRFPKLLPALALLFSCLCACSRPPEPTTLVMLIESSPANLDPRVGIDAQSERIDGLIFDDLLGRDAHLNVKPALAESWEIRDPLTYIFHLRHGVIFQDGRPLTSRDVKWTFDSLLQGKVQSTKLGVYKFIDHIDAPDDYTVVFHLNQPFSALLWNLSDGAIGIVPYGSSGKEMSAHPIGSGPFRFVSAQLDRDVVLERNGHYWGQEPKIQRIRFAVVPDDTTRALELRKGSADVESNALTFDTVVALKKDPSLQVLRAPGTIQQYFAFNLRDPILRNVHVRQAIAYAIDRRPMIQYLWRDYARPASSLLPPESWAYDGDVTAYNYDPARAQQLLDEAGYPAINGVRFHLTMKCSTEETTRLMAAVLQQQLRAVGIALDIRTFEFATFYSDVTRGEFQFYSLRWVGGNEDPDIFRYVFDSSQFPPVGANRGYYSNPQVDALIAQARAETDQDKRKQIYDQIQQILAEQVPYINLWYFDNVVVASKRVRNIILDPSGSYDFLKTAALAR
jgi:ABC-type transport system substrate-binding protein